MIVIKVKQKHKHNYGIDPTLKKIKIERLFILGIYFLNALTYLKYAHHIPFFKLRRLFVALTTLIVIK